MKSVILLFLFTAACAGGHTPHVTIDPAVQTYVDEWHADAVATVGHDIPITDLVIEFADLSSSDEQGHCQTFADGTPIIQIDQYFFDHNDPEPIQTLVYHELGHCILRLSHIDTEIEYTFTMHDGSTYQAPTWAYIMNHTSQIDTRRWAADKAEILIQYFQNEEL
jgi:hypothetical protein